MGLKTDVFAKSYTDKFVVSEDIDNLYYAKTKNGSTSYRQARFMRRSSDKKIIYCIEPFVNLAENTNYTGYDANYEKLLSMSKAKWKRISLLAYYGYGYKNHTADKWYSITQIMIWKTIDTKADFYWTDTFKGKKVTKFEKEMQELDNLVNNHDVQPSFINKTYDMSITSSLTLVDENNVLKDYEVVKNDDIDVVISDNKLLINSHENKEDIDIKLLKKDTTYNSVPIVYISDTYQNVLTVGSYDTITSNLNVIVDSGEIKIIKLDQDNNSTVPRGEGSLIGAIYEVFDEGGNLVGEIEISEDNTGSLSNLKYGKYKIKEKSSGKGYEVDDETYDVTIDSDNKVVEIVLNNKVIEKKVKLHKFFESENDKKIVEKNITFQIIDSRGEIYQEVTTDEYGTVEFDLPYGSYTLHQVNTTDGYAKVDDFKITIDEKSPNLIEYYLNDLKVPDTYQHSTNDIAFDLIMTSIALLGCILMYVKKCH